MSTEQELIRDLEEVGIHTSSIWDLVNGPNNYKSALPILIRHMESAENIRLKEGIVRALGVKGFDSASQHLIKEFKKSDDELYKWAIANSLEIIVPKEHVDELISIMSDQKYGRSRQMIALALGRIGDKKSVSVLIESLDDDSVAGHAVEALGMIGDNSVIESIRPLTKHKIKWIKNAANKAIEHIRKRGKENKKRRV